MANSLDEYLAQRTGNPVIPQSSPVPDDPVEKVLARDHDEQFNLATHEEDIVLVALKLLRPYSKHPFKAYNDEKMDALIESIRREGLHQPIIIRDVAGGQGYEILAGHNRVEAIKRLGERDIKALIRRNTDDDHAALVVVTTNLEQREHLLPSEKAFAYKLQMEALQHQKAIIPNGELPSDTNGYSSGVHNEPDGRLRCVAADQQGVSCSEIQRYIRLTYLLSVLLDFLDQGRVPVMAGYELSFLDTEAQDAVYSYFFAETPPKEKLTVKTAETLRAAYQAGKPITIESITAILQRPQKKKPGPKVCTYPMKNLNQYILPDDFDFVAVVTSTLDQLFKKRSA